MVAETQGGGMTALYFVIGWGLGYYFFEGVCALKNNPFMPRVERQEIATWMGAAMLAWFGVLLCLT